MEQGVTLAGKKWALKYQKSGFFNFTANLLRVSGAKLVRMGAKEWILIFPPSFF